MVAMLRFFLNQVIISFILHSCLKICPKYTKHPILDSEYSTVCLEVPFSSGHR